MSWRARWGSTVPAASVPVTVTVCRPRADTILPAQAAWRRAPCFLSLASMRALPAFLNAVGVGHAAMTSRTASCPGRGPRMVSRAGRGLGVQAPDPALGLVDLSGQVQVETGQHAQRRGVLVRGADGSQGVGHGAGGAGDHGRVLRVGLGAARCQVGDAAHRQPGQVAHGDAHVPGHRHGQGPDGGGLVHHHQKVTVGGQFLVQGAQTRLVAWQGLVEDLLAALGQGRGPVVSLADARCRRRPRCPRYPSFCRLPLKWVRTSRWTIGPAPTPAEDLTRSGSFPLSAVTGARPPPVTLAPRIIYVQGQDIMPAAAGPAPDHPGPPTR